MVEIKKKGAIIGVLIVAAILGAWRFLWQPTHEGENTLKESTTSTEVVTPVPATGASENTTLTEGEKTTAVKTSYNNPGGSDEVGFTLIVNEEGVISKASVEVLAKNPTSKNRQLAFAKGFPAAIQGKKLSELTAIDKVGGSSLTTGAFNASLEKLKAGI